MLKAHHKVTRDYWKYNYHQISTYDSKAVLAGLESLVPPQLSISLSDSKISRSMVLYGKSLPLNDFTIPKLVQCSFSFIERGITMPFGSVAALLFVQREKTGYICLRHGSFVASAKVEQRGMATLIDFETSDCRIEFYFVDDLYSRSITVHALSKETSIRLDCKLPDRCTDSAGREIYRQVQFDDRNVADAILGSCPYATNGLGLRNLFRNIRPVMRAFTIPEADLRKAPTLWDMAMLAFIAGSQLFFVPYDNTAS